MTLDLITNHKLQTLYEAVGSAGVGAIAALMMSINPAGGAVLGIVAQLVSKIADPIFIWLALKIFPHNQHYSEKGSTDKDLTVSTAISVGLMPPKLFGVFLGVFAARVGGYIISFPQGALISSFAFLGRSIGTHLYAWWHMTPIPNQE